MVARMTSSVLDRLIRIGDYLEGKDIVTKEKALKKFEVMEETGISDAYPFLRAHEIGMIEIIKDKGPDRFLIAGDQLLMSGERRVAFFNDKKAKLSEEAKQNSTLIQILGISNAAEIGLFFSGNIRSQVEEYHEIRDKIATAGLPTSEFPACEWRAKSSRVYLKNPKTLEELRAENVRQSKMSDY